MTKNEPGSCLPGTGGFPNASLHSNGAKLLSLLSLLGLLGLLGLLSLGEPNSTEPVINPFHSQFSILNSQFSIQNVSIAGKKIPEPSSGSRDFLL
jgi:hypothetical protein